MWHFLLSTQRVIHVINYTIDCINWNKAEDPDKIICDCLSENWSSLHLPVFWELLIQYITCQ